MSPQPVSVSTSALPPTSEEVDIHMPEDMDLEPNSPCHSLPQSTMSSGHGGSRHQVSTTDTIEPAIEVHSCSPFLPSCFPFFCNRNTRYTRCSMKLACPLADPLSCPHCRLRHCHRLPPQRLLLQRPPLQDLPLLHTPHSLLCLVLTPAMAVVSRLLGHLQPRHSEILLTKLPNILSAGHFRP